MVGSEELLAGSEFLTLGVDALVVIYIVLETMLRLSNVSACQTNRCVPRLISVQVGISNA